MLFILEVAARLLFSATYKIDDSVSYLMAPGYKHFSLSLNLRIVFWTQAQLQIVVSAFSKQKKKLQ